MKSTSFFTFGQCHVHTVGGQRFDKNTVVKITAESPRAVMFEIFGAKWAMEYQEQPSPATYPGGVVDLSPVQP